MTPEIKAQLNRGYRYAIACDHAGLELKTFLIERLTARSNVSDIFDLGTNTAESVDYPDYANKVCQKVISLEADRGIVICGSGIGMSIAANRWPGIRCALVSEPLSAKLSREHNNSNVIAFGARVLGVDLAWQCLLDWITTPYHPHVRHDRRMEKLDL